MKRLLGGAALVVIAVLVTATPAFAHAELESTSPESGADLPAGQPPDSVSMTFSEGVQLPENAVQLLNSDGQTVSGVGKAQHGDSDSVVTTALPALDDGTYVVDWHVVSVDSHPIDGAFTFNVGAATGNAKDVAGLVAGKNDHGVGIAFGLTRTLAFASVLVLVGGIFFLRVCSSESGNDSGVRAMLWVSWVVAFVTSFVGIGMQAAYTSSQDITKFFDATAIGDVMDTKFGQAWLIRAGLLILVLPALRKLSTARSLFVNVIDAALAVFVLATFTFSGHARTGRWIPVATVLDLVHLSAAAVWLGGIAILATLLVRRVVPHDTPVVTARFSRIAAPAITVIAVSGLLQALRQTDGLNSVFDTTYGRLLLTKIGLVILIVAAASVSRHIVNLWAQRHLIPAGPGAMRAEADPEDIRELRNAVVVEVAFAVIVLLVTSVLVNTAPARVDGAAPSPSGNGSAAAPVSPAGFQKTLEDQGLTFDVRISPALTGTNEMTVGITQNGAPFDPIEIQATMTNADQGVTLKVPLPSDAAGSVKGTVDLPFAGKWALEIRALRTEIDESVVNATVDIG